MSIRQVCLSFAISETYYRYVAQLCDEDAVMGDWLERLTQWQHNWGFGCAFCTCAMSSDKVGITSACIASIASSS